MVGTDVLDLARHLRTTVPVLIPSVTGGRAAHPCSIVLGDRPRWVSCESQEMHWAK